MTVECRSRELDANGMVADFTHIKRRIIDMLDYKVINDVLPFNPTAENLARWIVDSTPRCWRCTVQESEGNEATYEKD